MDIFTSNAKNALTRFLYRRSLMTSQAGQDYWVYGEAFNEMTRGYFVDIGAHDGVSVSNTLLLEARYRWSGLCIEANPVTFERLKRNRRAVNLNLCIDRCEGEVEFVLDDVMGGIVDANVDNKEPAANSGNVVKLKTQPLNRVFEEQNVPHVVDYLSIDVEGAEERVLGGFDFEKYSFRCITIERPSDLLRDLFKTHGYVLVKEIPGLDCFYAHDSFMDTYMRNIFAFYEKKYFACRWW